jgi:hypothetical protein
MKCTCLANDLADAVPLVRQVMSPRTTLPILSNVLLEVSQDGSVTITGTDLDQRFSCTIPSASGGFVPGSHTVHAGLLHAIVEEVASCDLPDPLLTFEHNGGAHIRVTGPVGVAYPRRNGGTRVPAATARSA